MGIFIKHKLTITNRETKEYEEYYGTLIKINDMESVFQVCDSQNIDTSERQLTIPDVSVAKRKFISQALTSRECSNLIEEWDGIFRD